MKRTLYWSDRQGLCSCHNFRYPGNESCDDHLYSIPFNITTNLLHSFRTIVGHVEVVWFGLSQILHFDPDLSRVLHKQLGLQNEILNAWFIHTQGEQCVQSRTYLSFIVGYYLPAAVLPHAGHGDVADVDALVCGSLEGVESGGHHLGLGKAPPAWRQNGADGERLHVTGQLLAVSAEREDHRSTTNDWQHLINSKKKRCFYWNNNCWTIIGPL